MFNFGKLESTDRWVAIENISPVFTVPDAAVVVTFVILEAIAESSALDRQSTVQVKAAPGTAPVMVTIAAALVATTSGWVLISGANAAATSSLVFVSAVRERKT